MQILILIVAVEIPPLRDKNLKHLAFVVDSAP